MIFMLPGFVKALALLFFLSFLLSLLSYNETLIRDLFFSLKPVFDCPSLFTSRKP